MSGAAISSAVASIGWSAFDGSLTASEGEPESKVASADEAVLVLASMLLATVPSLEVVHRLICIPK